MLACSLETEEKFDFNLAANAADARMVSRMRLVLAVCVLLAVFIDPAGLSVNHFTWLVLFGYLAHSSVVYVYSQLDNVLSQSRLVHRLDVLWFAVIVAFTGGGGSLFFLFFFFAILVSSFRWGLEEGARVTLASAGLFAAAGLLWKAGGELPVLLRTTFLLALGYMCVHWGESKVRLMRQLALLQSVSRLSNPRFGVDHTITSILHKTCAFFEAGSCLLVMQDKESGAYHLRTVKEGDAAPAVTAECIDAAAASPLVAFAHDQVIAYSRAPWALIAPLLEESLACDMEGHHCARHKEPAAASLAEMMEARAFISAPVLLRKQQGRIFVMSRKKSFDKADALFLSHMAAQAFPVIENIELLDKMACEAASRERQKMSLDLHDTAIQPYVGLKLGLSALRHQALADNPLLGDMDKLIVMTEKVIGDLRHYAVALKAGAAPLEPVLLKVLRQQTAQVREFYGVDIDIVMPREIAVSDRLGTEVLQLVREGMTNICKHTLAQRGFVKIDCANGWLRIEIENESPGSAVPAADFLPRSLSERAAGLGGSVRVMQVPQGNTVVHVDIPV